MQWITEFNNTKKGDAKAQYLYTNFRGEFQSYLTDLNNTIINANKICNEILAGCNNVKKEVDDFLKINNPALEKGVLKGIFDKHTKSKISDNISFYRSCVKPETIEAELNWRNLKDVKIKNNKSSVKVPPPTNPVQEPKPQEKKEEKKPEEQKVPDTKEEEAKKKVEETVEKKPTKVEEELNLQNNVAKGTVYVPSIEGLTTWNLALNNSLNIPNSESNYIKCLCFNYENSMLLLGTKNGTIHSIDHITQEINETSFNNHNQSVRSLIYFNDSKTFISGGKDGKLFKYELEYEEDRNILRSNVAEIPRNTVGVVRAIVSLEDGVFFYVGSDKNLLLYNINTNKEVTNIVLNDDITRLLWLKEERLVIAGLRNGNVVVVSHDKREIMRTLEDHKEKITGLTQCRYNGNITFASASKENIIKIYDVKDNFNTLLSFSSPNNDSYPKNLIYAFDGRSLFSLHKDGKLYVMEMDYQKTDKKRLIESSDSELTAALYYNNSLLISNKKGNVNFFQTKN